MTLELVGGANEAVGGATWPVGRVAVSTLTVARDLELSRTFAVLRSHSSAADSSTLLPVIHTDTQTHTPFKLNYSTVGVAYRPDRPVSQKLINVVSNNPNDRLFS